ncbi:MAG: RNB domain-containing ribonuclease, partial [Acidimicrobiales bacterium]|nr:RNB domain-containing ribonuclease [Acidimicrobiales bacterium]
ETRRRTQTFYSPDQSNPLHPAAIGADAASLLPDGERPSVLWTIDVNDDGTMGDIDVRRAMVRSRAQLTYQEVHDAMAAGRAPASVAELASIGPALQADASRRGAIELGLPEQEVVPHAGGGWTLALRANLPVEEWNAQISLLTGRAAAVLMLDGGHGILRTVPAADPARFPRLRNSASSLGIEWRRSEGPGEVLARLDMANPRHAAFADLAAELLRGSGYTPINGEPLDDPGHAGVGAPYSHVTAPLRRLVDRFGSEVCIALSASKAVPGWAEEAIAELPELMREGDGLSRELERTAVDATEAFVLHQRVGEVFPAAVMETGRENGTIVIDDPAVKARCKGDDLPLGAEIHARCTEADVARRTVAFERVS